jgi:hypothetical protein
MATEYSISKILDPAVQKQVDTLTESILRLNEATKSFQEPGGMKEYNIAVKQVEANTKTANTSLTSLNKTLAAQRAAEMDLAAAMKGTATSINDAVRYNKELKAARDATNASTKEGAKLISDYNSKIDQNTKFIKENSDADKQRTQGIGKYYQAAVGAIATFMAALAAAAGAIKFAKDVMLSNEAGIDRWKIVVEQSTEAYQVLLSTIKTGDWSNFLTNIREAIKEGERYQDVLNELTKEKRSIDVGSAADRAKIMEYRVYARTGLQGGNELTLEGRKAYAQAALDLELKIMTDKKTYAEDDVKNEMAHLRSVTKLNNDELITYIAKYGKEGQLSLEALARNKEITNKINEINAPIRSISGGTGGADLSVAYAEQAKNLKIYIESLTSEEKAIYKITKATEEGALDPKFIDKTAKSMENLSGVTSEYWSNITRMMTVKARLNKGILDEEVGTAKKETLLFNKTAEDFKKMTEKEAKDYEDYIKGIVTGEQWMTAEQQKMLIERMRVDDNYYKIKVESGIATQDEIFTYEVKKQMEAVEFAKMTAEQQAVAIKYIVKNALKESGKGAVAGEGEVPTDYVPSDKLGMGAINKTLSETGDSTEKLKKDHAEEIKLTEEYYHQLEKIGNEYFQNQLNNLQSESDADTVEKDRLLENAKGNKKETDRINAAFALKEAERAKESRRIQHDQAVYNQLTGVVNVGISTAVGAMRAYSDLGPIAGTIFAALIIAAGLVEEGLILSQKIPSYKTGRKGGSEELAKVHKGEIIEVGSTAKYVADDTLARLPLGASVLTADEVRRDYLNKSMAGVSLDYRHDSTFDTMPIVKELRNVASKLDNQKQLIVNIDKHGFRTSYKNGQTWENWVDNRVRLK